MININISCMINETYRYNAIDIVCVAKCPLFLKVVIHNSKLSDSIGTYTNVKMHIVESYHVGRHCCGYTKHLKDTR